MAQPVFDGHPLEEYFQDSGEVSEPMPGGIAESSLQPHLMGHPSISKHAERMEQLCFLIFGAVQSLSSFFSSDRASQRTKAFAERFKYGVISSSLLSPAFPATPMVESHRRGLSTSLPGKLSNGHSRTPSSAESMATDTLSLSMPPEADTPIWPLTLSFTIAIAAFSARFYFPGLLLLAGTLYYMRVHRVDMHSKPDVMTPSFLALQHLISAGQLWDTVINDTFTILENEEQSVFYGSAAPLAPSSSLRVALSTSLLTTQTQCDHVRQLLSAITSPSELAQLAEMYAPPSPIKSTFSRSSASDSRRPLSHPGPSSRGTPLTDRMRKRSTWNGSYVSLATPSAFQLAQRREKRRSDLSVLSGTTSPCPPRTRSRNALSSPPQPLADVSEEEDGMVTAESSLAEDEMENSFGAAALDLYRKRANGGLRALELPQRSTPLSPTRGNLSKRRTTMSPGSKYTSMHTTRHPFSLSSLRQFLQNALASKRFACSHLLALRFEDDEDEVYWEDVRAVMSLLTSTLLDASSRLSEVLDDVEEHHLHLKADDTASSSISAPHTPYTPSSPASPPPPIPSRAHLPFSQILSFAPTPSHLARFATHVGAISSALDDAREQLTRCVTALGEDRGVHSPEHSSRPSTSSCSDGPVAPAPVPAPASADPAEHPAIQAYERLRRELGLALRECERGRERLVQVFAPLTPSTDADADADVDVNMNVPRELSSPVHEYVHVKDVQPTEDDVHGDANGDANGDAHADPPEDDPSPLLLLSTPPDIEHVFEADTGPTVGPFTRARSGLSREERIQRMRAQRERPGTADLDCTLRTPPTAERWGPTPDVVQELKDVIWKVSQRRSGNVVVERHVSVL